MIVELVGKNVLDDRVDILKVPSRDSLVVFLFSGKRRKPVLLLKSPKDPTNGKLIAREARNLEQIGKYLDDCEFRDRIPRLFVFDGKSIVTNVIDGIILSQQLATTVRNVLSKKNVLMLSIVEWLINYHKKTFLRTVSVDEYVKDYLIPIKNEKQARFTPALEEVWESAVRRLRRIRNVVVPISLCHGDFNPYNILVYGEEISGVIDWTDLHENIPLIDFYNFITMIICSLPHRDYSEIIDRFKAFYGHDNFNRERGIYFRLLQDFNASLNIPAELNENIYQIHLILMALKWEKDTIPHARWEDIARFYLSEILKD
jgi:hypothetical protein